ncbi:uncharacterized protein [Palaemon carinicauda]|uniref:uncharacterized protein n=1 Tax=Palaemon carinicauda TaxID=392227 RepID=UPI0035B5C250
MEDVHKLLQESMKDLMPRVTTYLDDMKYLDYVDGSKFETILEGPSKQYNMEWCGAVIKNCQEMEEKSMEVVTKYFQELEEKSRSSQADKDVPEAADCEKMEVAYKLFNEEGKKPVPMKDSQEIKENNTGTKKKTFGNLEKQHNQMQGVANLKLNNQKPGKQNIPQGVMDFQEVKENNTGTKKKTFGNLEKQYNQMQEVANLKLNNQKPGKQNIPRGVMTKSMMEAASILKKMASEGPLYAIHKYNGGMRSAKITCFKDKLLLHRLRKKHPPSRVSVVCYNDVIKLVDPSSRLTFLQLGEGDFMNFGKVFIRLRGNTLAAKQFSSLCTGEMGHTYAGFTCVDLVNEHHKTLEYVRMGDYENCNGTGGKQLFPGLDVNNGEYVRPWVAGTVEGCWIWKKEIGAQFDILMKDNPGRMCEAAFGFVEEGFRVLRGAIYESTCVEMLCVHDCGIVLSQS